MLEYINQILQNTLRGQYPDINEIRYINQEAINILNSNLLDQYQIATMNIIIEISNILYNNTDRNILPLEDGIYDLLVEKSKQYGVYEIKAPPIQFKNNNGMDQFAGNNMDLTDPLIPQIDPSYINNSLFINSDDLLMSPPMDHQLYSTFRPIDSNIILTKMNRNIPHKYPNLVGTLDKCKFVLNKDAIDKGVFEDPTVKIFERDFLGKHIQDGLIDPNRPITLICELKNDGVSVEADVTNKILSARTRGDTDADIAGDLTPLLSGIRFPYAPEIPESESFGMKFEAIITKDNLYELCRLRGINYINCRVAIIGLLGASDAYKYRNFITLVPLQTSLEDIDRITELEFMNKYYNMGIYNRYSVIHAQNYIDALFQVHKFVQEAEQIRDYIPYMYDGVVVSYYDNNIRNKLGRKGAINQYQIAIKFNPLIRQTIFTGYTYSVGQNGIITPLAHYLPVEFFGSIHEKSSVHSYARFNELSLRENDIINVEYTNDVMPYATKANCEKNLYNTNPIIEFPRYCPSCNTELIFTDKSAICTNPMCPERNVNRLANMMAKLQIKDFSAERIKSLGVGSLADIVNLVLNNKDKIYNILGDVNGQKFINRISDLLTNPIEDYKIFGSIGFSNISIITWRKILEKIHYSDIMNMNKNVLISSLMNINGIGPSTADTIINERNVFNADIDVFRAFGNIIPSYTTEDILPKIQIRFTGCRDSGLELELGKYKSIDISGTSSVTKNTNILLVPFEGFQSTKTSKVSDSCMIISIEKFKNNINYYLPNLK